MDINELILVIKEELPNKAIDLTESLELLKETINDTMMAVNEKTNEAFLSRDFPARAKYNEILEAIYQYEMEIGNIISKLEIEQEPKIIAENNELVEKRIIPNYAEYTVDQNIEHSLYEDFTHKRPHAFRINEQQLIEVSTWKEMLVKTSELLLAVDENKIMSFENNPRMNGKKNKYFSKNKEELNGEPRLVSDKIFVETNMSGNAIRNLILKMLKEFGFKASNFKVYLRADYSELNKD